MGCLKANGGACPRPRDLPHGADASVADEVAGAWSAVARLRRDCAIGLGRVSSRLAGLGGGPVSAPQGTSGAFT
jgi:hypothetical protein